MEKFSWTDRVKNEVLQRVKEEKNILQTIKRWKVKWIGHFLPRIYFPKHIIERKIEGSLEVTVGRGRRRK